MKKKILTIKKCCLELLDKRASEPDKINSQLNNLWFCSCGNDLRWFRDSFRKLLQVVNQMVCPYCLNEPAKWIQGYFIGQNCFAEGQQKMVSDYG
jgi:hypothetical protein